MIRINLFFSLILFLCLPMNAQEFSKEFLESLPDEVRNDLLNEVSQKQEAEAPQYRRPSTFIEKPDVTFTRFGQRYFSMMQSSLMPINEPNFDPSYILDSGDILQLQLTGQKQQISELPIMRDGSINTPDLGKVYLSGISLEDASKIVKEKYETSFIGVNAFLTLISVRDIQVLIAGNAFNPGPYTLNGNSNAFHALSVSGGPSNQGSFRKIDLIRDGKILKTIDLYNTFILGINSFGPRLRSGDTIFIHPSLNVVSIEGAVKRPGTYELKEAESLEDLISFANNFDVNADLSTIEIETINDGLIDYYLVDKKKLDETFFKDGERVFIKGYSYRQVSILGAVSKPGTYRLNEGDGILELVTRAGGYTNNAYEFGGILLNQNAKEVEQMAQLKLYKEFLTSLISGSISSTNQDLTSTGTLLTEINSNEIFGRVSVEFNLEKISSDPKLNTRLMEGDEIIIPEIVDHVYVYGEISNSGTARYKKGEDISFYIESLGGFSEYADVSNIFVLHPNGVSERIKRKNVFRDGLNSDQILYPGSIIFIPRKTPNIFRSQSLQAYASIIGNLGVSLASISVLKD